MRPDAVPLPPGRLPHAPPRRTCDAGAKERRPAGGAPLRLRRCVWGIKLCAKHAVHHVTLTDGVTRRRAGGHGGRWAPCGLQPGIRGEGCAAAPLLAPRISVAGRPVSTHLWCGVRRSSQRHIGEGQHAWQTSAPEEAMLLSQASAVKQPLSGTHRSHNSLLPADSAPQAWTTSGAGSCTASCWRLEEARSA